MHLDDFDFDLPAELIALRPTRPRSRARLLVAEGGAIHEPEADQAFVATLRGKLKSDVPIFEVEAPINSEAFASAVLAHFDAVSPIAERMLPAPYASATLG